MGGEGGGPTVFFKIMFRKKTAAIVWSGFPYQVIVAGGFSGNNQLGTTEIIDLDAKLVYYGRDMKQARKAFHLATVNRGGFERVLALGGIGYTNGIGRVTLDTVEEWEPSGDTGDL